MHSPDLTLLYSTKDGELKNYLCDQLENNAAGDILIVHEPLEHLTWPLEPDKKKFINTHLVVVLLSQASMDFLEGHTDHLSEIKKMLKPEKTICVLFGVQRENLNHFPDHDTSCEEWLLIPREDIGKIIHTVQTLLEQLEKKELKSRPGFRLLPRKIYEGRGRVHIILDEPLEENQQLKVFSKEAEKTEIFIRKINPYNWQFLVPDSYMRSSSLLKVGISCKGDIVTSQSLKCESRLCQLYNLLSSCCGPSELMCDALGVNSYAALDRMLARAFKKRFPKTEICELHIDESVSGYTQTKEEIPTLVHFAARYGLKHLMQELLECPGTYSACSMKNVQGLTPAELAAYFKHHDLSRTLTDFLDLKHFIMTQSSLHNNLPNAPLSPNLLPVVSTDTVKDCEYNNYDVPPSHAIPVPQTEYDYIDENLPHSTNSNLPILIPGSGSSEALFFESQTKLLEINEAYKKGASELEVMSMFSKWQSTYHVDSEAKSTLEDLRNLYAQKNKPKLNKKQSASFSELKHLLSRMLLRRRDSTDSQDADNDAISHEVRYKYVKDKADSKSYYKRLSKTFSTTSNASASSSSSSDRLSVASEHSDYYDFVTSFKNHPGMEMCGKNNFSNSINLLDCKKSPTPLPRSPSVHPPQNFPVVCSKKTLSNGNDSSQHHNNVHHNEFCQFPAFGSTGTFHSDSPNTDGYDLLPFRAPLLVHQGSISTCVNGFKDSDQTISRNSCCTEYDTPRSPIPAWSNKVEDLTPLYTDIPCTPARAVNTAMNNNNATSSLFSDFRYKDNFTLQPAYGNICFKEAVTRRNSIPDEIAPAPPIGEEDEHYKLVGAPIPIANAK